MGGAMPLFIIVGVAFIGWLMWSSKDAKEMFLFCAWSLMILMTLAQAVYELGKWLFS